MELEELLKEFNLTPIEQSPTWINCFIDMENEYSHDTIGINLPIVLIKDEVLLSFNKMKSFKIKHFRFFLFKDGIKKYYKIESELIKNYPIGLVSSYLDEELTYCEHFYLIIYKIKEIQPDDSLINFHYIYEYWDMFYQKTTPNLFFKMINKRKSPTPEELSKLIDWLL